MFIHVYVLYSTEYTLTMGNIGRCLDDNVPLHMWKTLHQELRVPPRETAEEDNTLSAVKIWILIDPSASWQKFAMALYTLSLDGALKTLKVLKLLPEKGLNIYCLILFEIWIGHKAYLTSSIPLHWQMLH